MLQRRAVVAVPHDVSRDLRGDVGAGEVRDECRAHCVQVDNFSLLIRDYGQPRDRHHPLTAALAERLQLRLAVGIQHRHVFGQAGSKEVEKPRAIGNGRREHASRRHAAHRQQFGRQLDVKRHNIIAAALAAAHIDCAGIEIDISPFEPLQVAFSKPGKNSREIPSAASARAGDVQQPGQLVIVQRAAHPATIA